ncbi:CU044_2847 family protein [Kitasatospora sp. NPDC092948]|uniref:CU044_2847 family protein n=1 Tax=Kitasatospora sp. NPDC092948 TaxID=3364088 RepID=UPI003821D587
MADGTELMRVPLGGAHGDAGGVVMEVDEPAPGGRSGRAGEIAATATRTLAESFDQVRGAAAVLLERLSTLPTAPSTVQVELGVKINAEAGAVIAKTAAEGNFTIRLTWERPTGPT